MATRIYRVLLLAYPRAFREAHGDDLVRWFEDARRDGRGSRRGAGRELAFWGRILTDLARSVPREHWTAITMTPSHTTMGRGEGRMKLRDLGAEVRIALRGYARRPLFTLLAVMTLGIGIGAASTIYSVVDSVLLNPLPYPEVDRVYRIGGVSEESPDRIYAMSYPNFITLQEQTTSFEAFTASRVTRITLLDGDVPESHLMAMVGDEFFAAIGVQPAMGRGVSREDYDAQASVAVLSHDLWTVYFGGDPDVLGRSFTTSGGPFTVIGVMPEDFIPPAGIYQGGSSFWVPLSLWPDTEMMGRRRSGWLAGMVRLAPGVTPEVARAELDALSAGIRESYPEVGERHFGIHPLIDHTVGSIDETFLPLIGAVALLLLIACVNVANLLLVRASERARELGVRAAIGAGRGRIVRQLVVESSVLAAGGVLLGIALTYLGTDLFVALNPGDVPRLDEVAVQGSALLLAGAIGAITALVFGLAPALLSQTGSLNDQLRGGSRAAGGGRRTGRLWGGLIAVEAALALVLVVGAGLLINSFARMTRVEPGFELSDVYSVAVSIPDDGDAVSGHAFVQEVVRTVRDIPGVTAASATNVLPLSGSASYQGPHFDGIEYPRDEDGSDGYSTRYQRVTPGYFETLEIPVLRGRAFDDGDDANSPRVAVVNEALVRDVFGDLDPIGATFTLGPNGLAQGQFSIVGVVADARSYSLTEAPVPEMYFTHAQTTSGFMYILAESPNADRSILEAMRSAVAAVRGDVPPRLPRSLEEYRSTSIAGPRFYASLLGALAAIALALALVGVYGTLSYVFERRAREMGLRKALGATRESLLRYMLARGMRPVLVGVALGILIALPATRILESFVFEIEPTDPATIAVTTIAILGAALLAMLIPARRATSRDPMQVLREE